MVKILALAVIVSWSLAEPSFAQRGKGGGEKGGGNSAAANLGSGNSGNSNSGKTNTQSFKGNNSASNTSTFQQDGNSQSANIRSNTGANTTVTIPNNTNNAARQQQSFYRGSNDSNDRDNNSRDNNNAKNLLRAQGLNDRFSNDRGRFDNDRNNWSQTATRIRGDWSRRDSRNLPFVFGWWDNYPHDRWPVYSPFRYSRFSDRPGYWWGYTPADRLTTWLTFGWNRPSYWEYGPGRNIYYQDDYVYYDGNRYAPVDQYYHQIYDLAHSVPTIDQSQAEGMDWVPLGVFATTRGNDSDARTIQLAVNNQGVLAGTYFNPQTSKVHPVTGMVDKNSQRAAWTFADGENKDVVFETSIFNLTKPESTMMVHFGPKPEDTQVWHLVRLEQPENGGQQVNAQPAAQVGPQYDLP